MQIRPSTNLALACAAFSLLVISSPGTAQQRPGMDPNERQALLERFDADGDGKLSQEERGRLREYMNQREQREGEARQGREGREGREGRGGRGRGGSREVLRFMTRPDYMMSDLQILNEVLELQEDQQPIVSLIFEDYDASFRSAVELLEMSLEDIDASRPEPTEAMQEQQQMIREQMREIRNETRELRRTMMERQRQVQEEGGDPEQDQGMQKIRREMEDAQNVIRQNIEEYRAQRDQFEATDEMQELSALGLSVLRTFAAQKLELRLALEEELKAILVEQQLEQLAELDRVLRRSKQLRLGRLSGESVDLYVVLRDMRPDLDAETTVEIDSMLENYGIDLNAALVNRQQFDESGQLGMYEAMQSRDYEKSLDMMKRRFQIQKVVRDTNDQYIEIVAGMLPSEQAVEFRSAALETGYPQIYRASRVTRAIERARDIGEISPELLEALDAIELSYGIDSTPLLERMLMAVRMHEQPRELEFLQRRVDNDWNWGRRGQEDDPIREVEESRRDLDRTYMDRLETLLGEEQFQAIAGRGGRGEGRGGFGDFNNEEAIAEFDADGDGKLNEEERMALVRAMRSRFGNDRPNGGPNGGRGGRGGGPGGARGGGRGGRGDGGGGRGGRGGGDRGGGSGGGGRP